MEEPTFGICKGCPDYSECLGGHHEDCEIGYEDYLNSGDAFELINENSDIKVFHIVSRSDDLNVLQGVAKMLKEEHGQENMIMRRKHDIYELFTYPIIGHDANAKFGRSNE
jgi:hypothetical protein